MTNTRVSGHRGATTAVLVVGGGDWPLPRGSAATMGWPAGSLRSTRSRQSPLTSGRVENATSQRLCAPVGMSDSDVSICTPPHCRDLPWGSWPLSGQSSLQHATTGTSVVTASSASSAVSRMP